MRSGICVACFFLLVRVSQAICPISSRDPYMNEASPFGWPLAPNDWEWTRQDCWSDKFALCGGSKQSPINLDLTADEFLCKTSKEGNDGLLKSVASYDDASYHSDIAVSSYMRTVKVNGSFGSLKLMDDNGKGVVYDAVQVHLAAESLHHINGQSFAGEMVVIHKRRDGNMRSGVVAVSVLFKENATASSPIFSKFGFTADSDPMPFEMKKSWAVAPFSIASDINKALEGPSYQYEGSIPVPPCHETITWIVLPDAQPVSALQTKKLVDILTRHVGGSKKRSPVQRQEAGECRQFAMNSLHVKGSHEAGSCPALGVKKADTAMCWEEVGECAKSPIDISALAAKGAMGMAKDDIAGMMHYEPTEHVSVMPSKYTLDATVEHGGDFGYLMLNGRKFEAKKISVKPVSAHTINDTTYHAELLIEHKLYGDDLAAAHGGAQDGAATGDLAPAAMGHRRLENPDVGGHTVYISVPLKMGKESPLLRLLGLGQTHTKQAIRDGNPYVVHDPIDLSTGLAPILSGNWYWYAGSLLQPGCPSWGVRWIVFETPLELSFDQINYLNLPVSGLDSTRATQPVSGTYSQSVLKTHLPDNAVDADVTSECSLNESFHYGNPRCWRMQYPICESGKMQSPIDIKTSAVSKKGEDNFLNKCSWKPLKELRVKNTGYDLRVDSNQIGYVEFMQENGFPAFYQAVTFHVHAPSEHMIDGKQYPLELQVVHKKQFTVNELEDDDLLVTSFLFEFGEESPLLKQFYLPAGQIAVGKNLTINKTVDLMRAFGPALDGDFYRYDGSVTAPNCAEVVKWFVFNTKMTLSEAQWQTFKAMFPNPSNNRPIQPLNGRKVAMNSFEQGTYVDYRFFLGRETARNRKMPSVGMIFVPVVGTVLLASVVMANLFYNSANDRKLKKENAGGLQDVIGRPGRYAAQI